MPQAFMMFAFVVKSIFIIFSGLSIWLTENSEMVARAVSAWVFLPPEGDFQFFHFFSERRRIHFQNPGSAPQASDSAAGHLQGSGNVPGNRHVQA